MLRRRTIRHGLPHFATLTWRAMETGITDAPGRISKASDLCVSVRRKSKPIRMASILVGPFLETLSLLGELTREGLADPNSAAFQQGLDLFRGLTGTAMAHIWVITEDNSRNAQLAAGRAWLRVNLKATELGLSLQPLSQALQEYLEVQPHFEEVHKHLAAGHGRRIQMLGRLGYGPEIDPSPRWPTRDTAPESLMIKQNDDPGIFAFFNEIGIIAQLSQTSLETQSPRLVSRWRTSWCLITLPVLVVNVALLNWRKRCK